MIDAKTNDLDFIKNVIKMYLSDCEIRVFGSRIKKRSKKYSDIDIAIVSKEKIDWVTIEKIKERFSISDLPYRVDILDYNSLSLNFKKIVDKNYIVL
jgi:predicted nucleotidyltransferase